MSADQIVQVIIDYRYWILVPLSMIEGPIVAFSAGMLASLGYFNIFGLAIFFFARDMIMDACYYALGYYGGHTRFARRMLKRIGLEQRHLENIRTLWRKHLGVTMFLGKLSYGIAPSFIVFGGTVSMPLKKFFGWGAIVAIMHFWTLLALGYFLGATFYDRATGLVGNILLAIGGITLLASLYYLVSFYARKRLHTTVKKEYSRSDAE